MSRRKTRVTRMSRRKARSGTRKQNGGFLVSFIKRLLGKNPEGPNAVPAAPLAGAADAHDAPAPPHGQGGGARKTRHRRRRHRK